MMTTQTPGVTVNFSHTTKNSYTGPVSFGKHWLVMRPRESYHQHLSTIEITTSPESTTTWAEDIFGNMVATLKFAERASELEISSRFSVWRSTPSEVNRGPDGILVAAPSFYSGIEQGATYLYRNTVYPRQLGMVRKWLMDQDFIGMLGEKVPLFDRLVAHIREQIDYKRREVPGV